MKITLAKALKIKNRIAAAMSDVDRDIMLWNSHLKEATVPVDVVNLTAIRSNLAEAMYKLKGLISKANADIAEDIHKMAEYRSLISLYKDLNTKEGVFKEHQGFREPAVDVYWESSITKGEVTKAVKDLTTTLNKTIDKLDEYNASTLIDISDIIPLVVGVVDI